MGDMQEVEKLMPFQPNDWAIRTNGLPSPLGDKPCTHDRAWKPVLHQSAEVLQKRKAESGDVTHNSLVPFRFLLFSLFIPFPLFSLAANFFARMSQIACCSRFESAIN
jgi:hypothetical protein